MLPKLLLFLLLITSSFCVQAQEIKEVYPSEDSTEVGVKEITNEDAEDYTPTIEFEKFDSSNYPLTSSINLNDTVNKLLKQDEYWYVKEKFKKKEKIKQIEENEEYSFWSFFDSPAFTLIMWILFAGIIITAVVFFLVENDIVSFKKKTAILNPTVSTENEENIFEINFEGRLKQAIAAENFTLATRLLMQRLLKNLSLKNHITYSIEKTNLDYQIELSSKPFSQQVNRCIYFYDNVSYGDFKISSSQYYYIQDFFNQTEKAI